MVVNEKSINQEAHISSDNKSSYEKEDKKENSVNLMFGGFIIVAVIFAIICNFTGSDELNAII